MNRVEQQMRAEWNARAQEDAHYYVAFGRRDQDHDEFFSTADEILTTFYRELQRGTPETPAARRFLEIGCGPGRLMKPLSQICGEIHGVDVSDEMIARANANLAGIPHAHPHAGTGSTLEFADAYFDFVYSFAVFQHIPSRDVVLSYLRETVRVLKPGGLARLQINGLPKTAKAYTTWEGVRIDAQEIRDFAREHGIQLLALEGLGTQYMWTTWRKVPPSGPGPSVRIRRVTNAYSSEPAVPVSGRFGVVSLWIEGLDDNSDLNNLPLKIADKPATATYLGRKESDGIRQLNVLLPPGLFTGVTLVELAGAAHRLRLLPAPPAVPRIMSLTDGVDLMAGPVVSSGMIKLSVEEFEPISAFHATISGDPVRDVESFCVDPVAPRHEINFRVPSSLASGLHELEVWLGQRRIGKQNVSIL